MIEKTVMNNIHTATQQLTKNSFHNTKNAPKNHPKNIMDNFPCW